MLPGPSPPENLFPPSNPANLPLEALFKRAKETLISMMTTAPRKCLRRPGSRSILEAGSYCPFVAVRILGRKNSSMDSQAAEERKGRGVSP